MLARTTIAPVESHPLPNPIQWPDDSRGPFKRRTGTSDFQLSGLTREERGTLLLGRRNGGIGWLLSLMLLSCSQEGADRSPSLVRRPAADGAPNIVLITIDTLRPDHLSPYGYERDTAPFLNEVAADAWIWTHAFSTSSWTAPATASLFTGLYPNEHGLIQGFHNQSRSGPLELKALPAERTLPERLAASGYKTFGVTANINIGPELGFDRGFDKFERNSTGDANQLIDIALSWRSQMQAPEPYFLYLHFNDVHQPVERRAPWFETYKGDGIGKVKERKRRRTARPIVERQEIAKYDSEINYLDQALSRLFEELDFADDTVVFLVSDHGEEFGEHGAKGHGFSLYDELNRVLLMAWAPHIPGTRRTIDTNVSLVDVAPTLLELASAPGLVTRGRSLLPDFEGPSSTTPTKAVTTGPRTLFAHRLSAKPTLADKSHEILWAAIRGPWKLIYNESRDRPRLFNLSEDPREQDDRSKREPQLTAGLLAELAEFRRGDSLSAEEVEIDVTPELSEHLEVLGYGGADED